jgi:hypothetical protein
MVCLGEFLRNGVGFEVGWGSPLCDWGDLRCLGASCLVQYNAWARYWLRDVTVRDKGYYGGYKALTVRESQGLPNIRRPTIRNLWSSLNQKGTLYPGVR